MILERIREYLRGICVLISDAVLVTLILMMAPAAMGWELHVALTVWAAWLCVQFLVSDVMMAVGTSTNLYLIFNTLATVLGTWLTIRYSWGNPYEMEFMLFLGTGAVVSGIHTAVAAWRLPKSNTIVGYVDAMIIALAFYLYAVFDMGTMEQGGLILAALGVMALDLMVVNQLRTGTECGDVIQGSGTGGRLLLVLLFLACVTVTGTIVGVVSGQVHSAVDLLLVGLRYLWTVVAAVFSVVGAILARLILFLIMFLPSAPTGARESAMNVFQQDMEQITGGVAVPSWVLPVLAAVCGIALAGWVLWQFRGTKLPRRKRIGRKRKTVRKSHLFSSVKALLYRLADLIQEQWDYLRYRRSVQGLLVMAERMGRHCRMGRKKCESPGAYVRRLAEVLDAGMQPGAYSLGALAARLDEVYYAGGSGDVTAEAYRAYVRQLRLLQTEEALK